MNLLRKPQWTRHASRQTGVVPRICLAILLIYNILYTPIHLHRMPHSHGADFHGAVTSVPAALWRAAEGHDDDHHPPHPAAQHKLNLVKTERLIWEWLWVIPVTAWLDPQNCRPALQKFDFSGLSPPELICGWQFFFRAALPVRAPSSVS